MISFEARLSTVGVEALENSPSFSFYINCIQKKNIFIIFIVFAFLYNYSPNGLNSLNDFF